MNSPACPPARDEPSHASPEELPPAPRLLRPGRDAGAAGRPDTRDAGLNSTRGETETGAPRPRSASAGSARPAGAGGAGGAS